MTSIAGRVSRVELAFTNLRKAIKKDNGLEVVQQRAEELIEMLHTDAMILAVVNSLGFIASAGVGVAEKVCAFIMLIPAAFMQAMSAYVA